ncbi:hypothetical protein ACN2XU_04185 [Primorskyibacter sp. 2E107]|uniref:hypothetical protein n=1 Tax=Primorskyibacter sp. 2E107 TaxID=3403458 RepID=UPI003AF8B34E
MLTWLQTHAAALNVVVGGVTLAVWIAYLHLFFVSFRRARRAVIHIGMAAQQGEEARCLVTNMGADTVYILAIKVDLLCGDETFSALVTDRIEEDVVLGGNFRDKTNQGPLAGGEVVDIGSFRNILCRISQQKDAVPDFETCDAMEVTVVVAAQQADVLMGGSKRYDITRFGHGIQFHPTDVLTRQITSRSRRRALHRMITQRAG